MPDSCDGIELQTELGVDTFVMRSAYRSAEGLSGKYAELQQSVEGR